jgi:hypothetical protein
VSLALDIDFQENTVVIELRHVIEAQDFDLFLFPEDGAWAPAIGKIETRDAG